MTGREMCETIAGTMILLGAPPIDPEGFWEASPTGELAYVYAWYYAALETLERLDKTAADALAAFRTSRRS